MLRLMCVAALCTALLPLAAYGQETKGQKGKRPEGTWVRLVGDKQVRLSFQKQGLEVAIDTENGKVVANSDYGVSRDGVLFGRIAKVQGGGSDAPPPGLLFSFRFSVEGDTLTVSDFHLPGANNPQAARFIEGAYNRQQE